MNKEGIIEWIEEEQDKHFCGCGCGNKIKIIRNHFYGGIPKYKHGHNPTPHPKGRTPHNKNPEIDEWIAEHQGKHLCACGCGGTIRIQRHHYWLGIPKIIHGHNILNLETHPRYIPEKYAWLKENQGKHFCQCGCGQSIKIEEWHYRQGIPKYLRNHGQFSKEVKQKIRGARMKQKAFPTHHTKPELIFEEICKKYNLPFHYVGDGQLWIGKEKALNPDFCELNGKKIVIEIMGDYWHSPLINRKLREERTLNYRRKYYKQYGWKSAFLWESDLKREDTEQFVLNVLQKEGMI